MQLRYPEITASTTSEQIKQISSFLRQLVDNLNIGITPSELGTTRSEGNAIQSVVKGSKMPSAASSSSGEKTPEQIFNGIKGMIIKSADIIDAYCEQMSKSFSGQYIAKSEFGTYMKETGLDVILNSEKIQTVFTKTQSIDTSTDSQVKIINSNAVLTIGVVDKKDDSDVYGIQVGQITETGGEQTINTYATYTSEGVTLYDGSGNATAKLIANELSATNVKVENSIQIGGYREYTSNGAIIDRWVG